MIIKRPNSAKFDIGSLAVQHVATVLLKAFGMNPRDHSKPHVAAVARSIEQFGMVVPILCDEAYVIIAGHATLLACKQLGMAKVPVIMLAHLSEAEKVAFRIAHNRLCEEGVWDLDLLASNFEILYNQDLTFDLSITGFDTGAIDVARMGGKDKVKAQAKAAASTEEQVELTDLPTQAVARLHDRFTIGCHVIVCGDARDPRAYDLALGDERADVAICDPPYNVKIAGNVSGAGKIKHKDFVMASGEMDSQTFQSFIEDAAKMQAAYSRPGAYNCMFTGWYSMHDMLQGGKLAYSRLAHICIWAKTNGGLGAPWRNAWEGIIVHRVKGGKTQNNIMLGKHGRNRTDVFQYAGVNTFRSGRLEDLQSHPTCKPTVLLADLILDITPIRGTVLDVFLGSGSTILAAHETQRRGIGIELDPRYVDVAIARLEKVIGEPAMHDNGKSFAQLAQERCDCPAADL